MKVLTAEYPPKNTPPVTPSFPNTPLNNAFNATSVNGKTSSTHKPSPSLSRGAKESTFWTDNKRHISVAGRVAKKIVGFGVMTMRSAEGIDKLGLSESCFSQNAAVTNCRPRVSLIPLKRSGNGLSFQRRCNENYKKYKLVTFLSMAFCKEAKTNVKSLLQLYIQLLPQFVLRKLLAGELKGNSSGEG